MTDNPSMQYLGSEIRVDAPMEWDKPGWTFEQLAALERVIASGVATSKRGSVASYQPLPQLMALRDRMRNELLREPMPDEAPVVWPNPSQGAPQPPSSIAWAWPFAILLYTALAFGVGIVVGLVAGK